MAQAPPAVTPGEGGWSALMFRVAAAPRPADPRLCGQIPRSPGTPWCSHTGHGSPVGTLSSQSTGDHSHGDLGALSVLIKIADKSTRVWDVAVPGFIPKSIVSPNDYSSGMF